jgi:hypothetical protein
MVAEQRFDLRHVAFAADKRGPRNGEVVRFDLGVAAAPRPAARHGAPLAAALATSKSAA